MQLTRIIDVRVRELEPTIEIVRLPKDDVLLVYLVVLIDILRTVKPHNINYSMAISDVCNDSFLTFPHLNLFVTKDLPFDLYEWHIL